MRKILRAICLVLAVALFATAVCAATATIVPNGQTDCLVGNSFRAKATLPSADRAYIAFYQNKQMVGCYAIKADGTEQTLSYNLTANSYRIFVLTDNFVPIAVTEEGIGSEDTSGEGWVK